VLLHCQQPQHSSAMVTAVTIRQDCTVSTISIEIVVVQQYYEILQCKTLLKAGAQAYMHNIADL
jgi:hypothetical protein